MTMLQYLMNCMPSFLLMVVFYANFKWLTYRYFVEGKHRYYTIINFIMIMSFSVFLHYWMDFTRDLFQPSYRLTRTPDALDDFLSFVRDIANFCIFATVATCISLAQQWYWADKARRNAEAARVAAELGNLRSQINPHFLLNTLKMVSLADEVQFIENYINLMKIRLPQSVDVKLEKDLENPHAKVAPLLFISLVENAFKHGISSTEPSFIHMSMTQKGNSLCVIIENSNFPKSEKDRSGHGIGLQQVQRRLDLAYYERYEWTKGVSDDGTVYSSIIKITL